MRGWNGARRLASRRFSSSVEPIDVVFVSCGIPGQSMGWLHLHQTLHIPALSSIARVVGVVEPWFLGQGKDAKGSKGFHEFQAATKATHPDIRWTNSISDIPLPAANRRLMYVISPRTPDAPQYFEDAIGRGATHVYLEKPGAPDVVSLVEMQAMAKDCQVSVAVGYNKNVSSYAMKAKQAYEEALAAGHDATMSLFHGNSFQEHQLPEVFERSSEGMFANQLCHELAYVATHLGVTPETLDKVEVDLTRSERRELNGRTDFTRAAVTLKSGKKRVEIVGQRCGADVSRAEVIGAPSQIAYTMAEDAAPPSQLEFYGTPLMGYFRTQWADYLTLKEKVYQAAQPGSTADLRSEGVAGLHEARATLELAALLTDAVSDALEASPGVPLKDLWVP
mmetsp:Transcript_52596/g.119851  ORF Transcript_52596/g.119851 Transcript_52596/m.119851 type:complete len:393 (+) Transcript_52596:55-1233(+)